MIPPLGLALGIAAVLQQARVHRRAIPADLCSAVAITEYPSGMTGNNSQPVGRSGRQLEFWLG
jgi:hypothetical protein